MSDSARKLENLNPLDDVLKLNVLTQDEQQMVQIVRKHYFENGLITKQLDSDINTVMRNLNNVEILCQGDPAYERDLTNQLNEANANLKSLQSRIGPYEDLVKILANTRKESERLTTELQNEEAALHKIQESTEAYQKELDKQQKELKKLNESKEFKNSVHKHLKKNLQAKLQMIQRLKLTMEDLENKLNSDGQDLRLEQQRKQQQIDKLTLNQARLKQQLQDTNQRLEGEKSKFDTQVADWRERTRQATQRRNDVYETFQKGEMETKLLQGQLQRHNEKYKLISKRTDAVKRELEQTKEEIETTKQKIQEYASVPESHLATVRQLTAENQALQVEIDQLTKDEAEAREQAQKLHAEFSELEGMDAQARREKMERQQKNLRDSLEMIDAAVTAAESSYTCFECLKPVKGPMTFVPCGHSICRSHGKHTDDMLICPECKQQCETVFANTTIPDLLSKLQFLHSLVSATVEN
ncbi:hypothetical protein TVAG_221730 [Trichomonas vaginalis G3]|uniref:RING-type domain-containing protein n=1 Tax=Trichomonas vaginalis (strain ATCC PRA-98 / G3) TaxID=412133 RepID=A2E3C9_TRIV3|nr:A-type inclusion protein-related family [Trichomonas vaginalis G3]EAY12820.1 hypothetical protein TVAG_221730 [Trichomonas vaginalis G3]KAI5488522.1 A-type inclusion protein-related family [Trichomonas vaginalis G3]|eukprot:XP_001325043.1 hypothetical protein [Trichomonas vaginalis G3]